MKNFRKFILTKLFYLILGLSLAISLSYVYATWDDAKTGGSGELSETNWNALVATLENEVGKGHFVKCQVKFTGSPTYPTCPTGYTGVHSYASANIYMGYAYQQNGFTNENTNDSSWWYGNGTDKLATYACTVCKEN